MFRSKRKKTILIFIFFVILFVCITIALRISKRFTDFANKVVIKQVIAKVAYDIKQKRKRHSFLSVNRLTMQTVFKNEFGIDYPDRFYKSLRYGKGREKKLKSKIKGLFEMKLKPRQLWIWKRYKRIMNTARSYLGNPAVLRNYYFNHKNFAVQEIKRHGIQKAVKHMIAEMLPYFQGKIVAGPIKNASKYMNRFQGWTKKIFIGSKYQAMHKFHDRFQKRLQKSNNLIIQQAEWVNRRKKEGGHQLVNAWISILSDFYRSL